MAKKKAEPEAPKVPLALQVRQPTLAKVKDLIPHPRNYRKHPPDQIKHLIESMRQHGFYRNVVVAADGKTILAGHGVVQAAKEAGLEEVLVVSLPIGANDPRALKLIAGDNEIANLAEVDRQSLQSLLQDVKTLDVDGLVGSGFDDSMLKDLEVTNLEAMLESGGGGRSGEDEGPGEVPAEPQSKPGEIYALGPHRLLCGDSTNAEAVARLFGGEKARLVWTDPPYGIDVAGDSKDPRSKRYRAGGKIQNDGDETSAEPVITKALTNAVENTVEGAVCYAAAAAGKSLVMAMRAYSASGFALMHVLVWVKDSFVFSRCDYHYRHETILYGWKEGAHYFIDDRTQDSVFDFPRPKRSEEHPTMKPVELVERMVLNSSRPGDLVYDCFTGSGTTLIACAKNGRRFVGCELDPRYADVIRRRWTKFAKSANLDPGPGALE
jgi:DNA modification methylase